MNKIIYKQSNPNRSLLFSCIKNTNDQISQIHCKNHYNLYTHYNETTIRELDINIEFDRTLSKFNDPNAMIEQLIGNENATATFTDGRKSIDSKFVGRASICLEHSTLSTFSKTKMPPS